MNEFINDLQQLDVTQFQASDMTPWIDESQYQAGQFPMGVNPNDPSRLCVGFCAGFCGGFCGVFCSGFCSGFCGGFCGFRCGGFRCGGFHCGGFRCR